MTPEGKRWSGARVRHAVLIAVLLLTGCPPTGGVCEPTILAPERVSAPSGSTTELTVRFFNPTAKPLSISQLELSPAAPFSFRSEPKDFTVERGSCERPGEVGLVLRFSPTSVGLQHAQLSLQLDGAPTTVSLSGTGSGPLLSAASVVNFGYLGLAPSTERELSVRNLGTMGTSLEVSVVSVTATSSNTTAQELCVGRLQLGRCVPTSSVPVSTEASLPLVVLPESAGGKTWNVELKSGAQSFVVRVIANVIDTRRCQLTATPARLEFGVVLAPAADTQSTMLRNVGLDPCVILSATTSDPQFRVLNWPTTAQLVPVRGGLEVKAEASLTSQRSVSGTLTFELAGTNPDLHESFGVPLEASAPASCLLVLPTTLDVGAVQRGCSIPSRGLTFVNTCRRPLLISKLSVDPPFTLIAGIPASGITLSQGQAIASSIGLAPVSTIGPVSSSLRIQLEEGVETVVPLLARIEAPPLQTDTFGFDARFLLDMVLVLDDSPSFAKQHANTRLELNRLSTWASAYSASGNIRVAVTTTDVTSNGPQGRFRSTDAGVRWASADDSSFRSTFDELTQLTTTGAENQSCIEAAARAVTAPLANDPQANAGFRRAGGVLSVVCITDDLEYSTTPDVWRAELQGLDAGQRFTYSVVGPFDSTCPVDALDDAGTHAANVTPFWGITADICGPWNLFQFNSPPQAQRTTFFLTGTPIVSSLSVTLDGRALPAQANGQVNWRYDAAANGLRLEPGLLGRDPRSLIITYEPVCP